MNLKYLLGTFVAIPLLPLMYYQGKKIRKEIPQLPEATGITGTYKTNNNSSINLITIGESTIAGVGVATHKYGFTGTLAKTLAKTINSTVNWKVYAKSGYTAKRVSYKIIPKIDEPELDIIVIGLGGNDSFELNSPKGWNKDIRRLITKLKEKYPNTPVVFINMPPIKEFPAFSKTIKFVVGNLVQLLGHELKKVVKEYDNVYFYSNIITYDDFISRMNLDATPTDFFSDGIHPSELAYQVWAKDVAHYILKNNIIQQSKVM